MNRQPFNPEWAVFGLVVLGMSSLFFCGFVWFTKNQEVARSEAFQQSRPAFWRVSSIFLKPLERTVERFIPHGVSAQLNRFLQAADLARELSPASILAGIVLAGIAGGGLAVLLTRLLNTPLIHTFAFGFVLAGCIPFFWIRDRSVQREQMILRQLPFVLDLITLAVESGLNLSSALVETVEKGPAGILRNELSMVLRDIRAGTTRAEALQAMGERVRMPAVSNLVAGLIAADRQGGAIGALLRGQALQRRNERFARAEKLAMQAPVKMLFPLIVFIFPCTFIILFFPIFHRMVQDGWLK